MTFDDKLRVFLVRSVLSVTLLPFMWFTVFGAMLYEAVTGDHEHRHETWECIDSLRRGEVWAMTDDEIAAMPENVRHPNGLS